MNPSRRPAGKAPDLVDEQARALRQASLARLAEVERDWNRLVQGTAAPGLARRIRRELPALGAQAEALGLPEVSLLCDKLAALAAGAEPLVPHVPQALDLLVMMAIRFAGLVTDPERATPAALDLAGFAARVEEAIAEARQAGGRPPPVAAVPGPEPLDRLSAAGRRRLGRAGVLAFVESVRATGSARGHLREVWQLLAGQLDAAGAARLAPRALRRAAALRQLAAGSGAAIDLVVDVGEELAAPPEIADLLDRLIDLLGRRAIEACRAPQGGRRPARLAIRSCDIARDGELAIAIEDDGPAIDPASGDLAAARAAIEAVGGGLTVWTAEGEGTRVTLRAPRASAALRVHCFTACGGLELGLAVPADWTVAPIQGDAPAVDPVEALAPGLAALAPAGGFALRLTRGRFDLCWRAVGPVRTVTAERIGAPPDDEPAEVVRVAGREVLLLRPELEPPRRRAPDRPEIEPPRRRDPESNCL